MQTQSVLSLRPLALVLGLAGLASISASASAQGRLEWQVSPALQENWSSSINAKPGDAIDLRLRISYTGTENAIALGSVFFQPAISNWDASGPGTDVLLPFRNQGGNGSTPVGYVDDLPGLYGRITHYGWRAPQQAGGAPNPYTPRVHSIGGTTFLRIAQATYTSWIGGTGNTLGGGGMNVGQANEAYLLTRPQYPQFQLGTTDLVVLKLGITLSSDTDLRTLLVNTAEAFAGQAPNPNTTVKWYTTPNDNIPGALVGAATYVPATINVIPSPWTLPLMGMALCVRRRRR